MVQSAPRSLEAIQRQVGPQIDTQMAPNVFVPTNPGLADILGNTDFDFENFVFGIFLGPKFLAWAPLGPSLGSPGPSLGPPTWARRGPTHLGPAWAHPLGPSLGPPTWISRRRRRRRTNSQIQIQAPPNAPRDEILPQGNPRC